jgi:hypothetical protein
MKMCSLRGLIRSVFGLFVCASTMIGLGDLPAPPIRVASWITPARPQQKHELLVLGLVRSNSFETPRFIRWLGRQAKRWRGRLRVVAVSVLDDDDAGASKRLRALDPPIPVGLDFVPKTSHGVGVTAHGWLAAAHNVGFPSVFLVGRDGAIKWYGGFTDGHVPVSAFVHGRWENSAAARRFWEERRDREDALHEWRGNPVKLKVDTIKRLIDRRQWAEALDDTKALERLPRTDWLDPKKFAPFLRLSIDEQRRDITGFYQEAREIASVQERDAPLLNLIAWKIVDPHSHIPRRDWVLAASLAGQATRLAPAVAGYHDTLAWALYGEKRTPRAIRSERLALRFCQDQDEMKRCEAALSLFTKFPR